MKRETYVLDEDEIGYNHSGYNSAQYCSWSRQQTPFSVYHLLPPPPIVLLLFFFSSLSPDFRERKRALRPFWSSKWAGPPSICLFNFSWVYWKHSCNFNLLSTNYGMSDNVFSLYIPTKSSIKCNIVQVVLYSLAFISNYLHND